MNKPRYIMSITNDKKRTIPLLLHLTVLSSFGSSILSVSHKKHIHLLFLFVYLCCFSEFVPDNQFVKRRNNVNATISSRPSPSPQISLYSPPSCQARLSRWCTMSCRSSSDLSFGGNLSPIVGDTKQVLGWPGGISSLSYCLLYIGVLVLLAPCVQHTPPFLELVHHSKTAPCVIQTPPF